MQPSLCFSNNQEVVRGWPLSTPPSLVPTTLPSTAFSPGATSSLQFPRHVVFTISTNAPGLTCRCSLFQNIVWDLGPGQLARHLFGPTFSQPTVTESAVLSSGLPKPFIRTHCIFFLLFFQESDFICKPGGDQGLCVPLPVLTALHVLTHWIL